MQVIEATLLTGPYDWDEANVPKAEFEARLARVRQLLKDQGLAGLIVGGNAPEQGSLAYLTNYVPKMQPAIVMITADGGIQMRCMGGGAMRDAAQRLTWIEGIKPMREPDKEVEEWVRGAGFAPGARIGLGGETIIPNGFRRGVAKGIAAISATLVPLDAELDALRRRKSELELGLLRRAAAALKAAAQATRAHHAKGEGARTAMLAGERAAYEAGAQDVRLLASLTEGGMPRPLEGPVNPRIETLLACMMVRVAGYWAEGLFTFASHPGPAQTAAEAALTAMLGKARPGASARDLAQAGAAKLAPCRPHPFVEGALGNGIGLSRVEAPVLHEDETTPLAEGEVYVVRAGAKGQGTDAAITSAQFLLGKDGPIRLDG